MEYLFRDYDLYAVLEGQRDQMVQAINGAEASVVDGRPAEDIADDFVHQFQLNPPEFTEGAISVDVEEAQVDVSGDPNRFFLTTIGPSTYRASVKEYPAFRSRFSGRPQFAPA